MRADLRWLILAILVAGAAFGATKGDMDAAYDLKNFAEVRGYYWEATQLEGENGPWTAIIASDDGRHVTRWSEDGYGTLADEVATIEADVTNFPEGHIGRFDDAVD